MSEATESLDMICDEMLHLHSKLDHANNKLDIMQGHHNQIFSQNENLVDEVELLRLAVLGLAMEVQNKQ